MADVSERPRNSDAGGAASASAARRRFAWVAVGAAIYTYLLIVFGGIVRITGSGLGCGDDWPKCHGQWIPTFDLVTFIEWFHRLLAAGLVLPFLAMLLMAYRRRGEPGFGGRGGLLRPSVWIMLMLLVQALLGALTVKLELPPVVTAMHFGMASLLLAIILVAVVRAARPAERRPARAEAPSAAATGEEHGLEPAKAAMGRRADPEVRPRRWAPPAIAAAVVGFAVMMFGALTANVGKTPDLPGAGPAAWACGVVEGSIWRSFPLCNGQLIPAGGGLVHLHWTHRLVAILLLLHVAGATIAAYRRSAPFSVARSATIALGLIVLQFAVAVKLIFMYLPLSLQGLHLAVGVAVWAALVVWAALARQADLVSATAVAKGAAAAPQAAEGPEPVPAGG